MAASVGTKAAAPAPSTDHLIALVGNPNSGKSTVFNALTGLRQKVANYSGVTVEKKLGRCLLPDRTSVNLLDLPGAYSLSSLSPDEDVVRDVLLGLRDDTPRPELVVVVVDASNLERNLYLVAQVFDLGLPVIIALNMIDMAHSFGRSVHPERLERALGVPVIPLVARRNEGIAELREHLGTLPPPPPQRSPLPGPLARAQKTLANELSTACGAEASWAEALALRMLVSEHAIAAARRRFGVDWSQRVEQARALLRQEGCNVTTAEATQRYQWIHDICRDARETSRQTRTWTERIDQVVTHRVLGPIFFILLMALIFQSIFAWATVPMDWIEQGIERVGSLVAWIIPDGALRSLIIDGALSGVGAVLVFLPQILFLFFFLAVLDDSGYLSRAAFLMDRLMSCVGLHGRSFIPLMSSFACAIPGIMATRTIEGRRDRLLTIMIAPLMSCSARLPVYTLMIGAFIPLRPVGFIFNTHGLTLLAMYLTGIMAAFIVGWVFRRTILRGQPAPFLLELPPYRPPILRNVVFSMIERGREFVSRAGTVILAFSIVLWFLAAYPQRSPRRGESRATAASLQIQHSFAGRMGHWIEPVVQPLGFDWKMGIGLIGSFAAREVLVSTLATVYNVGQADASTVGLRNALQRERYADGRPVYRPLVAISVMVFFVLACQCMSTVAIVRRETGSWSWALFMVAYMTILAYLGSLAVYQIGSALGY